jgi:hypothetical protein
MPFALWRLRPIYSIIAMDWPEINWPNIHQSLEYRNQGLFATNDIQPLTFLASMELQHCICEQTLPLPIKNLAQVPLHDKLTLYLLVLKTLKNKTALNDRIVNWLKADTTGFVGFKEELIRKINDEQLLIEYFAYKKHYEELAASLHSQK